MRSNPALGHRHGPRLDDAWCNACWQASCDYHLSRIANKVVVICWTFTMAWATQWDSQLCPALAWGSAHAGAQHGDTPSCSGAARREFSA